MIVVIHWSLGNKFLKFLSGELEITNNRYFARWNGYAYVFEIYFETNNLGDSMKGSSIHQKYISTNRIHKSHPEGQTHA